MQFENSIAKLRYLIFILTKSQSLDFFFFFYNTVPSLLQRKTLSGQIPISRKPEQMVCAHVGIIHFPPHKKRQAFDSKGSLCIARSVHGA